MNKFNQDGERPILWKLLQQLMKEIEDDTKKWRYTMFMDLKNYLC